MSRVGSGAAQRAAQRMKADGLDELPIKVLCSGGYAPDGQPRHKLAYFGRRPGDYGGGQLNVKCPHCGRAPQITEVNFRKLVDAYLATGRDTLDISALPF